MAEGTEIGSIYFDLGLDTGGFTSQLDAAIGGMTKRSVKQFNAFGKSATSTFAGIGKKLAAGLSVAVIGSFTKSCLELGSNLTEVQNVVDTAFGSMSGLADKWAANAMTNFGLSETVAKKYLGTFGQMSSAMGITGKAALDMAESVTGLTGDVASFYNLSTDEAYTKLKSIWTGETESLKDLGVIMTQTNLDQYALNEGFGKTTASMTKQEKLMLRFQYVTSSLSNASGDFIKTQDSWANQTRILTLRFQQLKATLGKGFIALFTPIVKGINTVLIGLQKLADGFTAFVMTLTGADITSSTGAIASDLVSIGDDALSTAGNVSGIGDAAADTAKQIEKSLAGFDKINKLSEPTTDSSAGTGSTSDTSGGLGGAGVTQETTTVASAITDFAKKVQDALNPLKAISFDNLIDSFGRLKKAAEPLTDKLFDGLSWAYYNVFVPLAEWTIQDLLPEFLDLLAGVLDVLNSALDALKPLWQWAWDSFLQPMAEWTGGVIVNVLEGLTEALYKVSDWINNNQGTFDMMVITLGLFGLAWKAIDLLEFITNAGGVTGILKKMKDALTKCTVAKFKDRMETLKLCGLYAKDFVVSIATQLKSLALSAAQWIKNTALKIADTAATTAHTAATWLATAATTAFGMAMSILTSPITLVIGALALLGIAIYELIKHWDTVKEVTANVWGFITEIFQKFDEFLQGVFQIDFSNSFGAIGDVINAWMKNASNIVGNVKQVFGGLIDFISGIFSGNWSKAWNGIIKAFGGIFGGIVSIAKAPINMIIGLINGMLTAVESGINWITSKVNKLSFTVPKWVPGIGGEKFGFDLPEVDFPKIPMLAQGGYVKANTPQLAMIGDNRHQGEVVAPEDKIYELAKQAVQDAMGTNATSVQLEKVIQLLMQIVDKMDNGDLIMQVGDLELGRIVKRALSAINRRYNKVAIEEV